MENKTKIDQVFIAFTDKQSGMKINGRIMIIDEAALGFYSDIGFAKRLVAGEKAIGNKEIAYDIRRNVVSQKYPGKTRDEIREYIKAFMVKAGWRDIKWG